MLSAVNSVRAEGRRCGDEWFGPAAPLAWDGALERAAELHSEDMAANDHFSHVGTDGSRVGERASRAGYDWRRVGENIAKLNLSVEQVVEAWANSPDHCDGMMDPRYTEMGAAVEGLYWTQVFGRPD